MPDCDQLAVVPFGGVARCGTSDEHDPEHLRMTGIQGIQ